MEISVPLGDTLGNAIAIATLIAMVLGAIYLMAKTIGGPLGATVATTMERWVRRATRNEPRTAFLRLVLFGTKAMTLVILIAVYQTILAIAPEMHTFLYARLVPGSFASDFMPPTVFMTMLIIPAWPALKVFEYPFKSFNTAMTKANTQNTPRPFEDTGEVEF